MSTERRHAAAIERVDPRWDAARVESSLSAMHRKRARRRARFAVLTTFVVVAIVWVGTSAALQPTAPATAITAMSDRVVHLADGSIVTPETGAEVVVDHVSDGRIAIRLDRGAASVEVTRRPDRRFVVIAGQVVVTVLGTAFRVERLDDGLVRVAVVRGHVDVAWPGGHADLFAGDDGVFPRADVVAPPSTEPSAPEAPTADRPPLAATPPRPPPSEPSGWRELARASRYDEAYVAMDTETARIEPATASVDDLLLAADVARLSGHAGDAIDYLGAVERDHADDPRAVLATFTRGRLLASLGRSADAADEFERVLAADPRSSLAEDALARAAIAREAAGDHARAAVLAARYVDAYPTGRWLARVSSIAEGASLQ